MARIPAVPYCTVKGFRACLELLKREGLETLDRDLLIQRGFSPHAAYPVLGALRFLGLLDEQGRVLPTIASFMGDDVTGRRRLVEAAYHDLLPDVVMPVDERETVDRLLIEKHGVAPGVAPFCATFLLWVAAESGLPVADVARSRRGRPPAHLVQLSPSARAAMESAAQGRRHDGLDIPAAALAAGTHLPPETPAAKPAGPARPSVALQTSVE